MAILQRVSFQPNERLDTPDIRAIEGFVLNDFRFFLSGFFNPTSYILQGFEITNYSTIFTVPGFNLKLSDVVLFHSQAQTQAAGFYVFAGTEQDSSVTLAASATNFVEADFTSSSAVPDVRAFWDQGANGGAGGEFTDTVNTVINLELSISSNITGFTTGKMPLYKVITNASGIVISVTDCRNLFFRLGTGGSSPNPANSFSFPSLPDPTHARLETPITATVATPTNAPFQGGDKNINNFKAWMDAVMTSIKEIKGTPYWYMPGSGGGSSVPAAFQNAALIVFSGGQWEHLPPPTAIGHLALNQTCTINRLGFTNNLTLSVFADINLSVNKALYIITPLADLGITYIFGNDSATPILPKTVTSVTSSSISVNTGGNYIASGGKILAGGEEFTYTSYTPGTGLFSGVSPDPSGLVVFGQAVYQSDNGTFGYYHFSPQNLVPNIVGSVSFGAERTIWVAHFNSVHMGLHNNVKLDQGEETEIDDLADFFYGPLPNTFTDVINTTSGANQVITFQGGGTLTFAYPSLPTTGSINLSGSLTLAANQVAYCVADRISPPAIASLAGLTIVPLADCPFGENIFIFAYRLNTTDIWLWNDILVPVGTNRTQQTIDSDLNKFFGQLQLEPHPTNVSKVIVTGVDFTLSDGRILSQVFNNLLIDFTGAVINFQTGVINKSDDITPLGINFTPFTIPVGDYFWYSVTGIIASVGADNRISIQFLVNPASAANAVQANAPYPPFVTGKQSGAVQFRNIAGTITLQEIRQLGTGSGSGGSGTGNTTALFSQYITDFEDSIYISMNPTVFLTDGTVMIDGTSTGTFDLVNNEYTISTGQFLLSKQNLSPDFLLLGKDVWDVNLEVSWDLANLDTGATYQVSRNGGIDFQTVTMQRVDTSDTFVGRHIFADTETLSTLSSYSTENGNQQLNNSTAFEISQPFTTLVEDVFKEVTIKVNKIGSPAGSFVIQLIRDSAGSPSSSPIDVLAQTAVISIGSLSAGVNTVTQALSTAVLPAGTYHLVVVPDSVYRASFVNSVTEIDLRIDSTTGPTPLLIYNGTTWSTVASHTLVYTLQGRTLDLRVKVISSGVTKKLTGFMIEYDPESEIILPELEQQTIVFSGSANQNAFTIGNFLPNPYTLKVYDAFNITGTPVFVSPAFTVNGQVVTFPPNSFNLPGQQITLVFDQTEGSAIDTSDANATNITINTQNISNVGTQLLPFAEVDVSNLINAPFTQVVGRAKMPDPANTLGARLGSYRIMTQQFFSLPLEQGPGGERVFGIVNDYYNQIRIVGDFVPNEDFGDITYGTSIYQSSATNSFIEITFYGTGLNLLFNTNGATPEISALIDGGLETIVFNGTIDTILAGLHYNANIILNIAKGLSLGTHTIRVRRSNGNTVFFHGFEILDETANVTVLPGSSYVGEKKYTLSTPTVFAYNSSVTGTKGGRVVVYQNPDGTIGNSFTPSATSPSYLTSANHSNEEFVRQYYWREFSAGRGTDDDFFGVDAAAAATKASYPLDDNSTILQVNAPSGNFGTFFPNSQYACYTSYINSYTEFQFVGTGCDIWHYENEITDVNAYTVTVDGTVVGTISSVAQMTLTKLVSGLPYGSHNVKISQTTPTLQYLAVFMFVVYQPKTPALPVGAIQLGAYNVLANYVANATPGLPYIAQGVLRKTSSREALYLGTGWSYGSIDLSNFINGRNISTVTNGDSVSYTFWGTGFEFRFLSPGSAATATVTVDGLALTTGNFPGLVTSTYGTGVSYAPNTLTLSTGSPGTGSGFSASGLILGEHTLTITHASGANLYPDSFDIITPVHSHRSNLYGLVQDQLSLGNTSLFDNRKINALQGIGASKKKFRAKVRGVGNGQTQTTTSLFQVRDMAITFYAEEDGWFEAIAYISATYSGNNANFQWWLDGTGISPGETAFQQYGLSINVIFYASQGFHHLDLYWSLGSAGTGSLVTNQRYLALKET